MSAKQLTWSQRDPKKFGAYQRAYRKRPEVKERRRANARAWRLRNLHKARTYERKRRKLPEVRARHAAANRAWRQRNIKAIKAREQTYRSSSKCREYQRRWRAAHRRNLKEYFHQRHLAHRAERILQAKKWVQQNRKRHNASCRRRYAERMLTDKLFRATRQKERLDYLVRKKKASVTSFSTHELLLRWKAFDHRCAYCGRRTKLEQDHVHALSCRGKHVLSNIVPACPRCNSSKGNRPWRHWFRKQKFFCTKRKTRIERELTCA